jgi:hypothetical protein
MPEGRQSELGSEEVRRIVPTLMVGMNPGVQEGTFPILTKFVVFSAFLVAAVFEIKRLADQSSDENNY